MANGTQSARRTLALIEKVIAANPHHVDALVKRGDLLFQLGRTADALAAYAGALALSPGHAVALNNRAHVLRLEGRLAEALADFSAATGASPDFALAHNNRATVLQQLGRTDEALAAFARAVNIDPTFAAAWVSYGDLLLQTARHREAADALARAVALAPDTLFAKGYLLHAKMRACDWTGLNTLMADIVSGLHDGKAVAEPFAFQALTTSEADMKRCAEIFSAVRFPPRPVPVPLPPAPAHEKIRVGYVGAEFRNHAMSMLLAGLYEAHDPAGFEIYAFDNGWDDGSEYRKRVMKAFQEVIDISRMGDDQAARAVRARGIDILVDLNGFFGPGRQGVFSLRPAAVQVNFLGNPATLGAPFLDYIIADRVAIPHTSREHYTEQVAYMPHCYQPNDRKRRIAEHTFTRAELGLPEGAFVYCCFNNNYKITPKTFAGWMRILGAVPQSVLWLLADNETAVSNLRNEALSRGIDPQRLVFAPRLGADLHLARHRAADLFLDTLPYNAHTTASDALWAGLPVLTCRGTTFPGRVASSLLSAVGLPDLITEDATSYENLAIRLARQPQDISALRSRLEQNRLTTPLFDTVGFARDIEDLYRQMIDRHRRGLPPASLG